MTNEDVDFLISIQDLEQPDFDNACLERENKRLNKEIDRLNNIINETLEYAKYQLENFDFYEDTKAKMFCAMIITMLDKELKENK